MDKEQARTASTDSVRVRAGSASARPIASAKPNNKLSSGIWKWAILAVVIVTISGLLAYKGLGLGSSVDRSKYQAVFLSNGQVYFGKLSGWGGARPILTDVYYFQADAATQSGDGDSQVNANSSQTLVKLGEEIHRPTDKMMLNRDSILFVENIEDDGQVVEAIKRNQQGAD